MSGEATTDSQVHRSITRGLLLLGLGMGGFLLWAAWAPLDEGVPISGQVALDTKRKTVQHKTGGLVMKVLVHEGQEVAAGEELIVLNDGQARANYETERQRYLGMRATESRLLAEQSGKAVISFHPDVLQGRNDPEVNQHTITQQLLFNSRKLSLQSELDTYTESIKSQEEAIKGYNAQITAQTAQLKLVQLEDQGLRDLVKEGYAPRNKQWEQERIIYQLQGSIAEQQANIAKAMGSIAELKMHRQQRLNEARKEVDSQLADVQREVSADAVKFNESREELERTRIRAPVSGAVVGIVMQTVGGIIQAGARLMDIVPRDEVLVVEARLPPHLVDRISVGQKADVRFQGFVHTPELAVEGKLLSLSADLLSDPVSNESYYLTRILVTDNGLKQLGGRHLQAGMPVQVVIKTGERSVLKYLFDPIIKRMSWAMKEA